MQAPVVPSIFHFWHIFCHWTRPNDRYLMVAPFPYGFHIKTCSECMVWYWMLLTRILNPSLFASSILVYMNKDVEKGWIILNIHLSLIQFGYHYDNSTAASDDDRIHISTIHFSKDAFFTINRTTLKLSLICSAGLSIDFPTLIFESTKTCFP